MGLIVRKSKLITWPVTVKLMEGNGNGGVIETEHVFDVLWNPISEEEHEAMMKVLDEKHPETVGSKPIGTAARLRRNAAYFVQRVAGWKGGVLDESGNPQSYSHDLLTAMMTGPDGKEISLGFIQADNQIRWGVAPAKNAATSPAPGDTPSADGEQTSSPAT